MGKLLEPLWGAVEMLVFFMVVNVGVAMLAAFFYYLLYMVTFDTKLLFSVHIHGKVEHMKAQKESTQVKQMFNLRNFETKAAQQNFSLFPLVPGLMIAYISV